MDQTKIWTAWLAVPGIGRETFSKVMHFSQQRSISLEDLWTSFSKLSFLTLSQKQSIKVFQLRYSIEDYWQYLLQKKIQVLTIKHRTYPQLLREIADPPWLLFVKGNAEILTSSPMIAIVGTRRNTHYGKQATEKIVTELLLSDTTVVSGFMYGVDLIAHQKAFRLGGKTVAVLGCGFDHVTPRTQRYIYDRWLSFPDKVLFVSEYPPETQAKPGLFPMRNRIVAGLSRATVVVEAAARSGSLITAQIAIDSGRSVCTVPGSIFSRYSQGTKHLVNQGARLVGSGYEILDEIGWRYHQPKEKVLQQLTLAEKIVQELSACAQTTDDLCQSLSISLEQLVPKMTELEINGKISKEGGLWSCLL